MDLLFVDVNKKKRAEMQERTMIASFRIGRFVTVLEIDLG
jgi:hypothetical protein